MPLYNVKCKKCKTLSEEFLSYDEDMSNVKCGGCGAQKSEKVMASDDTTLVVFSKGGFSASSGLYNNRK